MRPINSYAAAWAHFYRDLIPSLVLRIWHLPNSREEKKIVHWMRDESLVFFFCISDSVRLHALLEQFVAKIIIRRIRLRNTIAQCGNCSCFPFAFSLRSSWFVSRTYNNKKMLVWNLRNGKWKQKKKNVKNKTLGRFTSIIFVAIVAPLVWRMMLDFVNSAGRGTEKKKEREKK